MLGWMDDEALARTLATGRATYWSRSRGEYWVKGETSGHRQRVRGGPARLRRRHRAAPGRPGGPRLPHRRAHLLRRRPAVGGRRPARGGAWLTAAACSAPPSSPVSSAAGLAALAGGKPWAAPGQPGRVGARRPLRRPRARSPARSAWWRSRAGASSWSPGAAYAARSPSSARWSPPGSSRPSSLGRASALDSARAATVVLGTARHLCARHRLVVGGPRRVAPGPGRRRRRRTLLRRAGPRWAAGTTRPRRGRAAEELDELDLWRAIDQGHDPTDPADH